MFLMKISQMFVVDIGMNDKCFLFVSDVMVLNLLDKAEACNLHVKYEYCQLLFEWLFGIPVSKLSSESELFQTSDYYGRPLVKKSSLNLNRPLNLKSFFLKMPVVDAV